MKRPAAKRQRGIALIALLAVIALGASWFLVSQLNAQSAVVTATVRNRNAEALNRAKQALIGYVAMQAAKTGENNPGRLPCPEGVSYIGDASNEGVAWGGIGTDCASIGRLPWRTLGLEKLVDSASEPLWYVVGPTWRLTTSTSTLTINSNTAGDISVDGQNAVALIIAPGSAMNAQAAAGCTARNQVRATPAPTMDARDYLECFDSATLQFTTTASSSSYNDQVARITVADVLPAIEAAIANRIEREIAPVLKNIYIAPNWGLSGTDRVLAYPATFGNPDTANFTGSSANTRGLLPFSYTDVYPDQSWPSDCTAGAGAPRCDPTLVSWSNAAPSISYSGGITLLSSCSYLGPTDYAECSGSYTGTPLLGAQITVSGPQSNGAMSLRQLRSATTGFVFWLDMTTWNFTWSQPSPTVQLNSDGTFTVSITATPPTPVVPLAGVMYWIYVPGNATTDHWLLETRTGSVCNPNGNSLCPSTSWFARNQWHKLTYYAIAPGYAASGSAPRSCTTGGTCLSVTNVTPAGGQRAILILAGRSIDGSARPSGTLGNYLEFGNATGAFERQAVSTWNDSTLKKPFNDRVAVVDSN
ncbi:MAG: hypothetical protein AB1452_01650 [Pseudomonadota bacterium]